MDKFPSPARSAATTLEPRVSAIVVAQRLRATDPAKIRLDLCLRSALAETLTDELIIVDLANDADISSMLRAFQADRRDVKLIAASDSLSAAAAANAGAKLARGRWVLFLDPDVVLQRGAVGRLTSAMGASTRTPCIIGGRLTDLEGRDRAGARPGALNAFSALAVAMEMPRTTRQRRRRGVSTTQVAAVSGAFMLMQRSDFLDLNGFDEAFVTDAADLDLCRRAADAGGSVLFQPAASGVQFERAARGRAQAQGLALFASKSAKTGIERAFAAIARPALTVLLALKDFVVGRPPIR